MTAVALDVSAVPPSPAGAGRYIIELARHLARRDDVALTLVTTRSGSGRWSEVLEGSPARVVSPVPDPRGARLVYERTLLARRLDRLQAPAIDVVHSPHYTMPSGVRGARVVTVHDVTFLEHPEWHERSKVPIFRAAIRRAAREADVVICVSRTTAERLADLVSVRGGLVVAEHGVDHERFCAGPVDPGALPGELAGAELIVHIGTLEPRKGVSDLVAAFDRIAATRPTARLVLAGTPGWGIDSVEAAIARSPARSRIHRLGYVPDATVVALLRSAALVAYPSFEEGFGLPALEALAVGAPLVTSEGTAMAEFAGAAAWLAPPGSPEALAGVIAAALEAPEAERGRRRDEGLRRAGAFTWERTADLHVAAYLEAVERSRSRRGSGLGSRLRSRAGRDAAPPAQ
jgi:glycosyltransferase involved in cell wall biosynthesis